MPDNHWQRWKGIMKCYPFEEKRLLKWSPPYIVQPKYDGDRCRNEPITSGSLLLTSEENIFHSVPHINEQLDSSGLFKLPLDGELYNHQMCIEGGHELIHSVVSRTTNLHPRYKEMEYWVFDLKFPDMHQAERLKFMIDNLVNLPPNIKLAPFWMCETLSDIKRVYDNLINMKYEGIIVRNLFTPYTETRSTMMMKFKPKRKDTYQIVGWNEEISKDGIPKGRIGSLDLSSQDGDVFSVSAGLNDEDRNKLWMIRDDLPGMFATVHYQHLTNKQIPKGCFDIEILFNGRSR